MLIYLLLICIHFNFFFHKVIRFWWLTSSHQMVFKALWKTCRPSQGLYLSHNNCSNVYIDCKFWYNCKCNKHLLFMRLEFGQHLMLSFSLCQVLRLETNFQILQQMVKPFVRIIMLCVNVLHWLALSPCTHRYNDYYLDYCLHL